MILTDDKTKQKYVWTLWNSIILKLDPEALPIEMHFAQNLFCEWYIKKHPLRLILLSLIFYGELVSWSRLRK